VGKYPFELWIIDGHWVGLACPKKRIQIKMKRSEVVMERTDELNKSRDVYMKNSYPRKTIGVWEKMIYKTTIEK
jgi:hypothetical protein